MTGFSRIYQYFSLISFNSSFTCTISYLCSSTKTPNISQLPAINLYFSDRWILHNSYKIY